DKLMAKNPDDRYQSAYGLTHDLYTCLSEWNHSGRIAPFELAQQDVSTQFKILDKLYGRAPQIACLMDGFDQVCEGATALATISGFSGIGKSSIIDELIAPMAQRRALFVSGKCDQRHRDIPYAPMLEAFRSLFRQLLAQSNEQVETWRQRILDAVGANGKLLIDLIPEAEHLLGPQPELADLEAARSRNRFHLVFEHFVQVVAQAEHPLVIFLDDLQWVDSATLAVVKGWLEASHIGALYVIGAYRDNEVDSGHALPMMLSEIERAGAEPIHIQVDPLTRHDVADLLADALKHPTEQVMPLAALIMLRTSGNPFFIKAFLTELHRDGLIAFDHLGRCWRWDEASIQQHQMADNVVDLMVDKIQRLSPEAQQTLAIASCIGYRFTLLLLASLSTIPAEVIYDHLCACIAQGFIVPLGPLLRPDGEKIPELAFAFAHDRIQQAAYSLVSAADRPVMHRQIGEFLIYHLSEAQQDEQTFEIVNHLNLGADPSASNGPQTPCAPAPHLTLAQWNLRAGRKALTSVAYGPALAYFTAGQRHLPVTAWQSHYELTLGIHTGIVESTYLCDQIEMLDEYATIVLDQARTDLDKIPIYLALIQASKAQTQNHEAVRIGLEALSLFGITFPENVSKSDEDCIWEKVNEILKGRSIEDLANMPITNNPEIKACIDILSKVVTAAWVFNLVSGHIFWGVASG
ncbi:ATP-binding protein, partial [Candidatus Entotheonella palauensis]|uniref:ATP-binding protein n=1 Tax=Candidatus Entotheonella palauensis TaxID=93172 RepID=UPI0015C4171B